MAKKFDKELNDKHDLESRMAGKELFEQIGCSLISFIDEKAEKFVRRVDCLFKTPNNDQMLVDVEHKTDFRWTFENVKQFEYPFPFKTLDYTARKVEIGNAVPSDYYVTFNNDYTLVGISRREIIKNGKRYWKYDKVTGGEYYYGAPITEVIWAWKNKGTWLAFESKDIWKPFDWDFFANCCSVIA